MVTQYALRMDGSNKPTKFSNVTLPLVSKNAPINRVTEGKKMNKKAKIKNGTTPIQFRQGNGAGRAFGASRFSIEFEFCLFNICTHNGHPVIANDFFGSVDLVDGRESNRAIKGREFGCNFRRDDGPFLHIGVADWMAISF